MGQVLVLNATYEPLSVVSVKRAIILLLKEKAELLEAAEARLRAERMSIPRPLVIRLVYYVKIPRRVSLPVTRKTILARDNYTCQYCHTVPPKHMLTVDHVLPRSRGGKTSWENVVTACQKCNGRKGSRTPAEANMILLTEPKRPRYIAIAALASLEAEAGRIDGLLVVVHDRDDRVHLRRQQPAFAAGRIDRPRVDAGRGGVVRDRRLEHRRAAEPLVAKRRIVDPILVLRDHGTCRTQELRQAERGRDVFLLAGRSAAVRRHHEQGGERRRAACTFRAVLYRATALE